MSAERLPTDWKSDAMRKRIARRYAAERRFKAAGMAAVLLSAAFLAFLLCTTAGVILLVKAIRRGHLQPPPWKRKGAGSSPSI